MENDKRTREREEKKTPVQLKMNSAECDAEKRIETEWHRRMFEGKASTVRSIEREQRAEEKKRVQNEQQ